MFLLNLGHRWTFSSLEGLRGVVVLPCSNPMPRVVRERPGDFHTMLLDPQLYLAGLRCEHRLQTCARLAGYPWFNVPGVEDFDSHTMGRREWDAKMREAIATTWPGRVPADAEAASFAAVEFQLDRGCSSIILPTPLVEDREDEGSTMGEWLDAGLKAAEELEVAQSLFATIAVSEKALNTAAFEAGGLLEALVDQVTARDGIDGAYIVIGQTGTPEHAFEMPELVAKAYLHLSHAFAETKITHVVTNFADLIGLACLGLHSTGFASSGSNSHRALHLDGFKDKGGGLALPKFYSHKTAGEYLSETDLKHILDKRLVGRINDETLASADLMDALKQRKTAATVPAWAESQNNIQAAQQHYVERLIAEGASLRTARSRDRLGRVIDWMETAEANALLVRKRTGAEIGRRPPVESWQAMLESIADS